MSNEEITILKEIAEKISLHTHWSNVTFYTFYSFLWASILSSIVATILAGISAGPTWLKMLLSAFPALAITVESTCGFSQKYQYHETYIRSLEETRRSLRTRSMSLQ